MHRFGRTLAFGGTFLLTILLVGGCFDGAALGLVEPPPEGMPAYGEIGAEDASFVIAALRDRPDFVLLDIRTPAEVEAGHIPGAVHIDYRAGSFDAELDRLDRDVVYLIYCRTANRTGQAFARMQEMGFGRVYDLQGGITHWAALGYPVCSGPLDAEHACVGAFPTPSETAES